MPIPRSNPRGRFLNFFSPKTIGLRWSKFSEKSCSDEKSGKKREEKKSSGVRSSQGYIGDSCKISRFESKKRRGHSPRNTSIWGFYREPTCSVPGTPLVPLSVDFSAEPHTRRIYTVGVNSREVLVLLTPVESPNPFLY